MFTKVKVTLGHGHFEVKVHPETDLSVWISIMKRPTERHFCVFNASMHTTSYQIPCSNHFDGVLYYGLGKGNQYTHMILNDRHALVKIIELWILFHLNSESVTSVFME